MVKIAALDCDNAALNVRKQYRLHTLFLISLGLLIYSNTFSVPFIFDDQSNIFENPVVRDWRFFQEPSRISGIALSQSIKDVFLNRYIGYLSFAINYHLHGYNLAGYHILNLAIHLINTLLVYWLVILTFRTPILSASSENDGETRIVALFAALLFVCHPIQTQAVTYIVQRFTSLATLFYLSAVSLYVRSRLAKQSAACIWLYIAALLAAFFAMRTKEISISLPLIIVLYEFLFFRAGYRSKILTLTPFLLTLIVIPLTAIIHKGGLEQSMTISSPNLGQGEYLFTQFRVIVTYLGLFFPPVIQSLDYDYPISHSFTEPAVILSFLLLASLIAIGVYLYFRSRKHCYGTPYTLLMSFGIFWFFITLFPESSVFPIADVIFEHRLYLPSMGFFIAITSLGMLINRKLSSSRSLVLKKVVPAAAVALILIFSGTTYGRNNVWGSEILMWQDTANKNPNKIRPHINLGLALHKFNLLDEALIEYQTAVTIYSIYKSSHQNSSSILNSSGWPKAALNENQMETALSQHLSQAHNHMGIIYSQQGRYETALKEFKIATTISPDYASAYNNRGMTYFVQGLYQEALSEFTTALAKKPDFTTARYNRGNVYLRQGRLEDAIREYQFINKVEPDNATIYLSIADAYYQQGRMDEALNEYQLALDLKPDFVEARQGIERLKRSDTRHLQQKHLLTR